MKVSVSWSNSPVDVFCISCPRIDQYPNMISKGILFYVLDGEVLVAEYEKDCKITNRDLKDFELAGSNPDQRYLTFIWKPLYELNIWEDLIDRDADAILKFSRLRETENGL